MPRPRHYAFVDKWNPEPRGRCDRGGEIRKLSELKPELVWSGDKIIENGFLVCDDHRDPPHPQDKPIVLKPDPVPVERPRVDIDVLKTRAMPVTSVFANKGIADDDMQPDIWRIEE